MDFQDLFGTHAVATGLVIVFDTLINCSDAEYDVTIKPQWSKTPQKPGYWHGYLAEDEQEVACDLLCAAWKGFSSTQPGTQVPRRCNSVLNEYRRHQHGTP